MRALGVLLLLVSGFLLLIGFNTDVSVSTSYSGSVLGVSLPTEVANIHGMHIQALLFQAAFFAFLAAVISFGFATLGEKLDPTRGSAQPTTMSNLSSSTTSGLPERSPEEIEEAEARGRRADLITYVIIAVAVVGTVIWIAVSEGDGDAFNVTSAGYEDINLSDPLADNFSTDMNMDTNVDQGL